MRAEEAYGAILDPKTPSDAAGFGTWAPRDEREEKHEEEADEVAEKKSREDGEEGSKEKGEAGGDGGGTRAGPAPSTAPTASPPTAVLATRAPVVPSQSAASSSGPQRVLKFVWSRDWLQSRLVGVGVHDEEGNIVGVREMSAFAGEAYVERTRGPRSRVSRVFDLSFELTYQVRARPICGRLSVDSSGKRLKT